MKTIGERIVDLRESKDMKQKVLAEHLGITAGQLSRIEKGETTTLSSDILIGLTKEFSVSADYILGLTPVQTNNHELSELHLTEKACEKLIRNEIDGDTLSRLMEHEHFGLFIKNSKIYFHDVYADGFAARNDILNTAVMFLRENASETENPNAVKELANHVQKSKTSAIDTEQEELKRLIFKILKETKQTIKEEQEKEGFVDERKIANNELKKRIHEIGKEAYVDKSLSHEERLDRITDQTMEAVSQQTGITGKPLNVLGWIYKKILKMTGKPEK